MGGAEVKQKLSSEDLLIWPPALGVRLHRRLDSPQTPNVGERPGDAATLGSVELARRRAFWRGRAGRRGRSRMPAAAAATGRHQPEYGDSERESPRRRRLTGSR
jgi:hypothetical protein